MAHVVFDFDHTLVPADSFARFCVWQLRRQVWRWLLVALVLPAILLIYLSPRHRKLAIRIAVWACTFGLTPGQLDASIGVHVEELVRRKTSLFYDAAICTLRGHLHAGDQVIIATGCYPSLVRALLATVDMADLVIVGSSIKARLGGIDVDQHCIGKNKPVMLAAAGFPGPFAVVYTDHYADLLLLKNAEQGFLVNPTAKTLAHIQRKTTKVFTVLRWC